MAFLASATTLGRSCKAMAKAKAKGMPLARESADRLRDELLDAAARTESAIDAAAMPSPWDDMGDILSGVPCTECHVQHHGICSIMNLLIKHMSTLNDFAEVFLPSGPQYYDLRGALYTLMGIIYATAKDGGVTLQDYKDLHADVLSLIARCDVHVGQPNC